MFLDYELLITSKILIKNLGFYSFNKKNNININDYYLYYINPNFFNEINNKKIFIFIGYNLRLEAPILNIKLRKKKMREDILYFVIGSIFNDNLNSITLGLNTKILLKYLQGKLKICNLIIKKIKKINFEIFNLLNLIDYNMFFLGNNIINRVDNKKIYNIINKYSNIINLYNKNNFLQFFLNFCKNNLDYYYINTKLYSKLNIIYINLTNILYEEFGFSRNIHNIEMILKTDILYLLGIDNLKYKKAQFMIFQGHHINLEEYLNIDLIFPSITFLEKSTDFLNIEGNCLQTNFVLYPPVFCRND